MVNSLKADATYVLQTGDGATIVVTERAVLPNVEVEFETGSQTYAWLNNITAWATGTETNQAAALNFWQVRVVSVCATYMCGVLISRKIGS